MAVDYTDPVQQVRLLTGDTSTTDPDFTDEQVRGFLTITNQSVFRAAADALDATASSEALISKKITTQDRSTDGAAVADALRKHAAALRKRADDEDAAAENEPFFMAWTITPDGAQEGEEVKQ